jgi:acyl-CoA thioesterase I
MISFLRLFFAMLFSFVVSSSAAHAATRILAFGDSLTAGYGLKAEEAFPAQLEAALKSRGHDVTVINGGISGDTTAGGKERLEWALSQQPDMVILALGANDMLRGFPPVVTRANLDSILHTLTQKNIVVVLAGMKASMNLGPAYAERFNEIFPDLASKYELPLYPFFLEDVAMKPALNLEDGLHPNAKGIAIMVKNILPVVETSLRKVPAKKQP